MAAAVAAFRIVSPHPSPKPSIPAIKPLIIPLSVNTLISPPPLLPILRTQNPSPLRPRSAVQDIALAEAEAEPEKKRKLYVVNLPWSYPAPDIQRLFAECGTVKKVEIIKRKNGQGRGFSYVTMASGEEARAVIDKFDSYELLGRVVRVEFAKSFRKPSPPAPPGSTVVETRHQIYASNLAWEVRSTNLREFFSSKYNPVSARVVFDNQRSAGYGFVSFATEEEAEACVSELDGKELMGRPLRLKINQNNGDGARSELDEADNSEGHSEDI